MSGHALVLSIVDTSTGHRHLVAVEVVPLHRRSERCPALCGEVIAGARRTLSSCATCAAAAAGTDRAGRFFAVCGADVVRADDLTDPGFRRYCWSCRSLIPRQRSRDTR